MPGSAETGLDPHTTPCRMTGVTLHTGLNPQTEARALVVKGAFGKEGAPLEGTGQGYLAHKKPLLPRTLGVEAVSYERGTPVAGVVVVEGPPVRNRSGTGPPRVTGSMTGPPRVKKLQG